jgi:diguanylate cyclase (GGDEF)-like protein
MQTSRPSALLQRMGGRLARLLPPGWSEADWTRRDLRDAAAIIAAIAVIYGLGHIFDLPPKVFQFAMDHADWEIDDIVFVIFVMSLGCVVCSCRRARDLAREARARRRAELEAQHLARNDPLTGLPNRRCFVERLGEVLAKTAAESPAAVFMIDLDGFKAVNDVYGHMAGDQALIEFADRAAALMPPNAILSRMGGDEFAAILPIRSVDDAAALARRITAAMTEPFLNDMTPMVLGAGIGIALAPADGTQAELLVRRADRALYSAKAEGRSCIRFFEPKMNEHVERRMTIERELRAAMAADLIVPHYQPLVAFEDRRVVGFEALARWNSETLGWVGPDLFIRVAEEIGVIGELGDRLLRRACTDARGWPAGMTLAFNVSALQLRDPTFGLRVLRILGETGFDPRRLELEITETVLVGHVELAQRLMRELRGAGIRIALDDFGTGYATLSHLLSFQLDRIKIDRSFVTSLGQDEDGQTIVGAILGLARGFGLQTTAEGIETHDQLSALSACGCKEGQGFLFGKAVPADEVPVLLSEMGSKLGRVA